jgi:PST family polysaccharide transporter
MLRATLIDASLCVASILVGLHWGVVGIAASLAAMGLLVRTPFAFWLATRRGPVSAGFVWRAVAPPASAAAMVALAIGCLRRFEPEPTLVALVATAVIGLSTASLALFAWPEIRREVRQLLNRRAVVV